MDKNKKYLLAALFIALTLRIGYVLTLEDKLFFPDSFRFHQFGIALAEGREHGSAFTAPFYPLFLSGIYRLFGVSYLNVRIAQALVGTASILLVFLLGRDIFSEKVGLIASFISAFYPFFIFFTGLLLTETLFIFLFLSLIYLLQRAVITKKIRYVVGVGLISGLCILTRPIIAYFLPFALFILLLTQHHKRQLVGYSFLIMILAGAVLSPWVIRNYQRFGKFIPLTTGGGITLYGSNNPRATGGSAFENIVWTEEMKRMDEIELDRHFRREAIQFMVNNPRRTVQLAGIRFKRFWNIIPNVEEYRDLKHKLISIFSYGPVLLFGIGGIILTAKKWRKARLLYLPIAFFILVHLIILGSIRYRVPIMPFVIIFAAYACSYLFDGSEKITDVVKSQKMCLTNMHK